MFSDSEIAKSFSCGRTKCALVTNALAPHFRKKLVDDMSLYQFSIMIDESNDSTDKSCIILVRILDPEVGDVCTRFLDMPVVNIGTAKKLYEALKASLENFGLIFPKP